MVQDRKTLAGEPDDLYFGPFRLEKARRLWRGEELVEVRPRPLAMLRYLAERPGRLVTSDELLNRLWPGIYVTRTVIAGVRTRAAASLRGRFTRLLSISRQSVAKDISLSPRSPPLRQ